MAKLWTEKEFAILRSLPWTRLRWEDACIKYNEKAEKAGFPRRTHSAIKTKAWSIGFVTKRVWSEEEIEILHDVAGCHVQGFLFHTYNTRAKAAGYRCRSANGIVEKIRESGLKLIPIFDNYSGSSLANAIGVRAAVVVRMIHNGKLHADAYSPAQWMIKESDFRESLLTYPVDWKSRSVHENLRDLLDKNVADYVHQSYWYKDPSTGKTYDHANAIKKSLGHKLYRLRDKYLKPYPSFEEWLAMQDEDEDD